CLERFQELVSSMKKTRPIFDRKCAEIFQAYSPNPFQLGVLHQRFSDIAQGCGGGVLRGEPGHARASMHLYAEVKNGQHDCGRADHLRDRINLFPVHPLCYTTSVTIKPPFFTTP